MKNVFTVSEVVEIGIQIERNGKDFYNAAAKKSKNQIARDTFAYLEGEEEQHIVVFNGIRERIQDYKPEEAYTGEYFSYMNALASEHVFLKDNINELIAKEIESDIQVIDVGIKAEKDSILFYESMKKMVPQGDHAVIDVLIAQEQNHLRRLHDMKSIIK